MFLSLNLVFSFLFENFLGLQFLNQSGVTLCFCFFMLDLCLNFFLKLLKFFPVNILLFLKLSLFPLKSFNLDEFLCLFCLFTIFIVRLFLHYLLCFVGNIWIFDDVKFHPQFPNFRGYFPLFQLYHSNLVHFLHLNEILFGHYFLS